MGRLTNELFREIVSLSSQAVAIIDVSRPKLKIVFANRAYEELSGFSANQLEGSAWLEYAAMDASAAEFEQLMRLVENLEHGELSFPFFGRDGEIWSANLKLVPLGSKTARNKLLMVEHTENTGSGHVADLPQLAVSSPQMPPAGVERTDPVTGLLSNAEFRLLLKRELAVARRRRLPVQLMLFSILELDVYQQTFGAAAADSCVRMIAAQIAGTFRRASDLSARVGRSTLAVSVTGQDRDEASEMVAQIERKARNLGLHNPRSRFGRHIVVQGVSIAADPDADDVDGLMARAEAALYARGERRAGAGFKSG